MAITAQPQPKSANPEYDMREFDDVDKTRELIYSGVLSSVAKRFPIEDDEYRLELHNPRYAGPLEFGLEAQKQALMKNRNLQTPLVGTWRLVHKPTNNVVEEREDTVMQVPYYTQRGTFVNNGSEYTVVSQARLRPGVYVRKQRTGEIEGHFNVKSGTGRPFRVQLEPKTGLFKVTVGQSKLPLYPMLKALGATDRQLAQAWGAELLDANSRNIDPRALSGLYSHMAGYNADDSIDDDSKSKYLAENLPKFELDEGVVARTLGLQGAKGVTPDVLLRTTAKMLGVSRGEEEPDDRDSPRFSGIMGVEDLISERVEKDAGKLTKNLMRKIRRAKSLKPVYRNALNPYVDSLMRSSLASPLEETNPLHVLEQLNRVTKLGEGGIGSAEAITDEARDVNPGNLGFADPIAGPECWTGEAEVMTRKGWARWDSVSDDTEFACLVDGEVSYFKPEKLHVSDYSGKLYGAKTKYVSYLVTPNHRIWCRPHGGGKYRFEPAEVACNSKRLVDTGSNIPYAGAASSSSFLSFTLPDIAENHGNRYKSAGPIDIVAWASFIGWYLSEGSLLGARGNYRGVVISQQKPDYMASLEETLSSLPFGFCKTKRNGKIVGYAISGVQLARYLDQFGKSADKRIPEYLFEAPSMARRALLESLCFGDGRKKRETFTYCTTSRQLAIDVERLAFTLGIPSAIHFEADSRPQSRHGGCWTVHLHLVRERFLSTRTKWVKSSFYETEYTGKVYCATVPGGLLYCRHDGCGGHWSGNSEAIGIDFRTAYKTFKGKDGRLYGEFVDRSGETVRVAADDAIDSIVGFPGQDGDVVYAMKDGKMQKVPRKDVDYFVPSFAHMFSPNTNLNPMPTSVQAGRQFYGSKFWTQYMPQVQGDVPLVDSLMPDGKSTFSEYYGRKVGTLQAKRAGTVQKVTDKGITIVDDAGNKQFVETVQNLPFNRLSAISYFPTVKPGDKVNVGDMVAHSNFTDPKTGALNLGRNLKTAVIPFRGESVAGDTNVFWKRPDGGWTYGPIASVPVGVGMESQALDTASMQARTLPVHCWAIHAPESAMYEISTMDGMSVTATGDHSFVGFFEDADTPVKCTMEDLVSRRGMVPVVQPNIPFGTGATSIECKPITKSGQSAIFELDRDFGWVVGLYVAEGCPELRNGIPHSAIWAATEPEIVSKLESFFAVRNIRTKTRKWQHKDLSGTSGAVKVGMAALAAWLADNCVKYAWNKKIPDVLWTAPKEFAEGFIDGYFCGDGTVTDRQCTATTTSRLLADGLTFLLAGFGIRATWHEYTPASSSGGKHQQYCVWLFREFLDKFPRMSLARKQERVSALLKYDVKFSRDRIPIPVSELPVIRKLFNHRLPKDKYISRALLRNVYHELPALTKTLVDANVWWDVVTSAEQVDSQPYVYDLDMRPLCNFAVGSGWIVHNSNEDAYVISESAAKKLATERLFGFDADSKQGTVINRNKFMSAFPDKFTKDQFGTLDDDGVVKPGTVLHKGDPIVAAVGPRLLSAADAQLGKLHKVLRNSFTDKSQVWEYDWPGTVVDVAMTAKGAKVNVKSTPPVTVGDKLCYSDDTEVLTRGGWKLFKDLSLQDEIAGLDPDSFEFEYMLPEAIQRFNHVGKMYALSTQQLDLCVTPNHNLFVQPRAASKFGLHRADSVAGKRMSFKKDGIWRGTDKETVILPGCEKGHRWGYITVDRLELPTDVYLMLLGMFLSEGNCIDHAESSSYGIQFTQIKPDGVARMLAGLRAAGFNNKYAAQSGKVSIFDKRLLNHFKQFGHSIDKFIPNEVFDLPPDRLKVLFDWLMWGDGHSEYGKPISYTTASKQLADDVQRLCLHIGYAANIKVKNNVGDLTGSIAGRQIVCRNTVYSVRIISTKLTPTINHGHVKQQAAQSEVWTSYAGHVYCCTLPKWHVLYVRRNGKAAWCGNSTRMGLKGITGKVIPDDKMPRNSVTNEPYDVLLNPMTVLSRVAPNQIMELALGKIAAKTGKQIRIPQIPPAEGWAAWVKKQMDDAGVEESSDLFDPESGKTIKGIGDGVMFVSAFHHLAEKKLSARGGSDAAYNSDEQAAHGGYSGGKKFCFAAHQPIRVFGGEDTIGHIVEKRIPAMVWAAGSDGEWGWHRISNWYSREGSIDEVLNIKVANLPCESAPGRKRLCFGDKSLYVTKNHVIYRHDGSEVKAQDLIAGDWLASCGYVPTDDQLAILRGSMLGDGAICDLPSEHRFYSEMHSEKQSNYVKWKHEMLGGLVSNRSFTSRKLERVGTFFKKQDAKSVSYLSIHRHDVCDKLYNEFYVAGKKRLVNFDFSNLNELGLAVLFLDDGSAGVYKNKKSPQGNLATMGFLQDDCDRLALRISEIINVRCARQKDGSIYLSSAACERLAELVLKYVPLNAIPKSKRWLVEFVAKRVNDSSYVGVDNRCRLGTVPVKVLDVSQYVPSKPLSSAHIMLYDIEVEDVHRYCASDVLVSNSSMDVMAALSHGSTAVIKDVINIRGTKNEEFWKALKLGRPLPEPGVPFIYDKFLNTLRAGGINVVEKGDITQILPMTDDDVDRLAKGTVDNSDMVDHEFEPRAGGLFDVGRTGGLNGRKWTAIKLPEPIPNPVMEEPIRRMLGLKVAELEDVIAGRKQLEGKTGGEAIKAALEKVDIDKMIELHRDRVRTSRGANRDNSVKILGYLDSAKKNGIHPAKWVISKVPVLPPVFRPVSKMGDVALVADLNELYRDVIESSSSFSELKKDLPDSALDAERLNIYGAVKAAYGLGEPITPEGQSKRLKGAIRQVVGTSPKTGMAQSKVFSKPVDVVGRGVAAPDPNLDMDQVGIPEDAAWDLYKDFTLRNLVMHGYPAVRASEMIEKRTPEARDALDKEMSNRPVILDRAPTLHKFNLMGFYPHIAEGNTIRVSPIVCKGFNLDFDGDKQIGKVIVFLDNTLCSLLEATKVKIEGNKKVENNLLTKLIPLCDITHMHKSLSLPLTSNGRLFAVDLSDFPHGELISKKNGANGPIDLYAALPGTKVVALKPDGSPTWADVTYWSVHHDRVVEIVNLRNGRQIITDDDPRAVFGVDPRTGNLYDFVRDTPTNALNRGIVVPCLKNTGAMYPAPAVPTTVHVTDVDVPFKDLELTQEFGWVLGAMAGDGWCNKTDFALHGVNYRNAFGLCLADLMGSNAARLEAFIGKLSNGKYHYHRLEMKKESNPSRYGDTVKHTFMFDDSAEFAKFLCTHIGGERDESTSGAANKRLPTFCFTGPIEFRKSVICGLIDTDGSVSVSNANGRKQLMCSLSTTSIRLATDVQLLCRTIGVRASITTSSTPLGNPNWVVALSASDVKRDNVLDNLCNPYKRMAYVETAVDTSHVVHDTVVITDDMANRLASGLYIPKQKTEDVHKAHFSAYMTLRKAKENGFVIARNALDNIVSLIREEHNRKTAAADAAIDLLYRIVETDAKLLKDDRLTVLAQMSVLTKEARDRCKGKVRPAEGLEADVAISKAYVTNSTVLKRWEESGVNARGNAYADRVLDWLRALPRPRCVLDDPDVVRYLAFVGDRNVSWSPVESVERTNKVETGYDLTVPGYETFMSVEGVILSNTMNFHVPVSDKAVEQVKEKMLPSKNLFSLTDLKSARYSPTMEMTYGLYKLTDKPSAKPSKVFRTQAEAIAAYRSGEIGANDPVEILEMK